MELAGVSTGKQGVGATAILNQISLAKSRLWTPEQYQQWLIEDPEADLDFAAEAAAETYPHYQRELQMANALDFDDMIIRTIQILRESDRTRDRMHRRFRYVMVDEYQDTNYAQNVLTNLITGPHQNICVVGDPNQSIYGWRNADITNIVNFTERYPNAKTVRMGRNYRSTSTIVDAAQHLIARNATRLDNPLQSMTSPGPTIRFATAPTADREAQWAIDCLRELVDSRECAWKDCAVMYRMNAQSRPFEDICVTQSIPYRLIGGVRFYERREIKDVLAYLRIILNPGDTVSLQRVINTPPRRIGATTVKKLMHHSSVHDQTLMQSVASVVSVAMAQERPSLNRSANQAVGQFHAMIEAMEKQQAHITLSQLFDAVIDHTGLELHIKTQDNGAERWENVLELRSLTEQEPYASQTAAQALASFLERVSLVQNIDQHDEEEGVLTLITLHQAKGLEFTAVAMPGLAEGTLPMRIGEVEEERRLCYVGITRARRHLAMSWPEIGHRYGYSAPNQMSRFIDEIPPHYFAAEEYLYE